MTLNTSCFTSYPAAAESCDELYIVQEKATGLDFRTFALDLRRMIRFFGLEIWRFRGQYSAGKTKSERERERERERACESESERERERERESEQ